MEIDLFRLMKNNKIFKFGNSTTTDLQKLTIIIDKDMFKGEYIGNFGIKFVETKDGVEVEDEF